MDECRTLVEQIERILANPDSLPSPDELRLLSEEYAQQSRKVNERLSQCDAWLGAGENSEAIRIAEAFEVLELYNLLQFPQCQDWFMLCRTLGFPPPPPLSDSQARALLRAYDTVSLMEQLLDQYRLGALQQSPIKERLFIVYQLEKCEPQSEIWASIIPEYEKVRFDEMEQHLMALPATLDSKPAVDELLKELRNNPWRTSPPESLANRITKVAKKLHQQSLLLSLEQIVGEMQEAYSANDADKCGVAVDNWNFFIRANRIPLTLIPSRLTDNTRGPMSWYAEISHQNDLKNQYAIKLDVLEASLQHDEDMNEIAANYSALSIAAENAGISVPDSVVHSYRSRLGLLDLQMKRKLRVTIIGICALCLLIGLGLYWGVKHTIAQKKLYAEGGSIKECLDQFESVKPNEKVDFAPLERAGKYIDQLRQSSPGSLSSPFVREQISRYEVIRAQQDKRGDDFIEFKRRAEDMIERNELDLMTVERLENLARSDEEKLVGIQVRKQYELRQRKEKALRDGRYRGLLGQIVDKVNELENKRDVDVELAILALNEIEKDLDNLNNVAEGVTAQLIDSGDKLRVKSESLKKQFMREANVAREYDELVHRIGSPARFIEGLKSIATKHAGSAAGKEADNAIAQFNAVKDLEAWNSFIREHADGWRNWENTPDSARKTFDEFNRLESVVAFVPEYTRMQRAIERVKGFVEAGGRIRIVTAIDKLYGRYSAMRWLLFRKESGRYYYLLKKPVEDDLKPEYQSGKTGLVKTLSMLSKEEIARVVEAPPCVLSQKTIRATSPLLSKFDNEKWIQVVSELLLALNPEVDSPGFDPLVKALFLADTLSIICQDTLFKEEFGRWLSMIDEEREFDRFVNWFDPVNPVIASQRRIATILLQKLPVTGSLDEKLKRVRAAYQEAKPDFNVEYRWIGFVNMEQAKYECRVRPDSVFPDGLLYLCRISPVTDKPELILIGKLVKGKAVFNVSLPGIARGLPVFLKVER